MHLLSKCHKKKIKMAFTRNFKILFFIVYSMGLIHGTQVSNRDLSSLINLLSQKNSANRRPVILLLDAGGSRGSVDRDLKPFGSSSSSSSEVGSVHVPHLLLQHHKVKKPLLAFKKSTTKSLLQLSNRDRQLKQLQKLRVDDTNLQRDDRDVLRSPIVKRLLRISNSLRCDAKDNCQNRCVKRYRGKKEITCKIECQVKYECDEEEDPCDEGGCDSCANSGECQMSTKGERLVPDEPICKRC